MRKNIIGHTNLTIFMLVICFCFMAIGYAYLSQQLKVNGTAKITGEWDIHFTKIEPKASGGATNKFEPTGIGTTTATFSVNLNEPGDKMTYYMTVSNLGNIDAIVEKITELSNDNNDIIYKIDGIKKGNELKANDSIEFKVVAEYNKFATQVNNVSRKLVLNIDFVQKMGSNIDVVEQNTYEDCFSVTNGTISSYDNECTKDVVIPDTINGEPVTKIDDEAFLNRGLTSIKFPVTLTSIGAFAFAGNGLRTIDLPPTVIYIGAGAFNENHLTDEQAFVYARNNDGTVDTTTVVSYGGKKRTDVVVPDGVIVLGEYSFNSLNIKSITISNSVKTFGQFSFAGNLFTDLVLPDSVTDIQTGAFYMCQTENITMGNSIKTIGDYAFYLNHLKTLSLPNSVTYIGNQAFRANDLTSVDIQSGNIAPYAFQVNLIETINLGNGVTAIGNNAFTGNFIADLVIPDSVTSIGNYAFDANKLTNVTVGTNVSSIGNRTFYKSGGGAGFIVSRVNRTYSVNPDLQTITNKTGKEFDWGKIINGSSNSNYTFEIGNVVNSKGNVEIKK